jgi:hypothetical protein
MKTSLLSSRAAALALCAAALSGCSMGLALSVPKDGSRFLEPGAKRSDVIAALGKPIRSVAVSPPSAPPARHENWPGTKASLCDEYRVSGLLLTPDEAGKYENEWNIYPAALILTGGATEALALPGTIGDLTIRAARRYRLRLWYSPAQRLIDYDKH